MKRKAILIRATYEVHCGYCNVYLQTRGTLRKAQQLAEPHRQEHQREWDAKHTDRRVLEQLLVGPERSTDRTVVPEPSRPRWQRMFGVKR